MGFWGIELRDEGLIINSTFGVGLQTTACYLNAGQ